MITVTSPSMLTVPADLLVDFKAHLETHVGKGRKFDPAVSKLIDRVIVELEKGGA